MALRSAVWALWAVFWLCFALALFCWLGDIFFLPAIPWMPIGLCGLAFLAFILWRMKRALRALSIEML